MNRTISLAPIRAVLAALVLLVAAAPLAGCGDDMQTPAKPASAVTFKSFKPGAKAGELGGGKAAAGSAASQDAAAPKVEEGDVARLEGTTLYVLNQWRGLQIVDLKDPAKPSLQARVAMTGVPREMYVGGGEAIVALSQVATLDQKDGKPLPLAGSQIRRVSLGASPKDLATLVIPGYVATTKRIGDKLVVVLPQVNWNPWWYGCWGPYGCLAAGGVKSASGTTDVGTGSGASIAYPGGYNGGWTADKTKVVVVDLAKPGALSVVGEIEFDGGVLLASIEIGEVLIASQQWQWLDAAGTQGERLTQVLLASDGKPSLGAVAKADVAWTADASQVLLSAHRLGAGRLALARQYWQAGKSSYAVENWKVEGAKWQKTAAWQKAGGNQNGARLAIDGTLALLATAEGTGAPGKGEDGTDETLGAGIGIDVLDLADAATVALASHTSLPSGGWDLWSAQLKPLPGENWLVTRRGTNYTEVELRVLDLTDPSQPNWLGKLPISSDYGMQVELLSPDLLAVPVLTKAGTGNQVGMQLISLGKDGGLTARGLFQSSYTFWYQLKNLLADKMLLRIANAGLEVVDLANLDQPKVVGTVDLAAEVIDTVAVGERLVTLVANWQDNKFWLRVLPKGGTDELKPEGQIETSQQWGRLYANGNFVYLADGQTVRVFDITDPKAPKARGKWQQESNGYDYMSDGKSLWWNTWSMPQQGSTLYLLGQQVQYTKATGKDCASPSTGSGSSGASPGASEPPAPDTDVPAQDGGSAEKPAGDAGSTDPAKPDAGSTDPESADGGAKADPDAWQGPQDCWIKPIYTTKIAALDLADPDAPKLAGTLDLPGVAWAQEAQVSGNVLALTHYESLQGSDGEWYGSYWLDRVDIAKPTAPKLMDQMNIPGWLVGLSADGKNAVTLDWQLKAGTKPEDSKVENTLNLVTLEGGKAVLQKSVTLANQAGATLRHGDAVYVSTWPYWWTWPAAEGNGATPTVNAELLVFDAKDPAKFGQSAVLNTGAGVSSLQVAGNHLFAQTAAGIGMTVWGLANPTQPAYQGFLPTQGGWSSRVVAFGGKAYLPAGWYGIGDFPLQ